MSQLTTVLICGYRPLNRAFHPSVVRPVFDKVRVVRTLCPKEYPEQMLVNPVVKVEADPHEDHGKRVKRGQDVLCEVVFKDLPYNKINSVLRCITFEMEIEVSFEDPESDCTLDDFLALRKPSIKARVFDWPRLDSDEPIFNTAQNYDDLAKYPKAALSQVCEVLQKLQKLYPQQKIILWKYDPFRETTTGGDTNTKAVQKNRLENLMAYMAQQFQTLRELVLPEQKVDFALKTRMGCSYWFCKWDGMATQGLNSISRLQDQLGSQEVLLEFQARIRPILMLLRDILEGFYTALIPRLSKLEVSDSTRELIKTYTGLLDRVNDLLASDLTDIVEIQSFLKITSPLKLARILILSNAELLFPQISAELVTRIEALKTLGKNWPILPSPTCVYYEESHQQVFFSLLMACMRLIRGSKPDMLAPPNMLLDEYQTLHSRQETLNNAISNAFHKDFLVRLINKELQVWKIWFDTQTKNKELKLLNSIPVAELLGQTSTAKVYTMGNHVVITGYLHGRFVLKMSSKMDNESWIKDLRFLALDEELYQKNIPQLECTRMESTNDTKFMSLVKVTGHPRDHLAVVVTLLRDKGKPNVYSQLLDFGAIPESEGCECVSSYLTKRSSLFTCILANPIGQISTLVQGALSAFRVTTESLELSFSTKIELECIGIAYSGHMACKSARFFKVSNRVFFIFSLAVDKFALFANHNNKFCRVSGGKTSDESPVYSYPALASMCESRDTRGQPGNSLYYDKPLSEARAGRGEYQLYRLRIKPR